MPKLFLLLLFVITYCNIFSQTKGQRNVSVFNVPPKHWLLKINPLTFLQLEPAITLGAEYRLYKNIAVSLDAGYVFNSLNQANITGANGITLKPAVRNYFGKNKRTYVEGELMYKLVNFRKHDWLGMDCVNGVSSYQEFLKFSLRKHVYAFNVKFGEVFALSRKNDKISLESYVGLGVRYKNFILANAPANSCYENRSDALRIGIDQEGGKLWLPNITFGIRIVFNINAFKKNLEPEKE